MITLHAFAWMRSSRSFWVEHKADQKIGPAQVSFETPQPHHTALRPTGFLGVGSNLVGVGSYLVDVFQSSMSSPPQRPRMRSTCSE